MTALRPHAAQWNQRQATSVPHLLADVIPPGSLVWDPCAGTGVAFHDHMGPAAQWVTVGTELEPEWAGWRPCRIAQDTDGWWSRRSLDVARTLRPRALGTLCADSTQYPHRLAGAMDAVVTSLAFNNRMNDRYVGANDHLPGRRTCQACAGTGRQADTVCTACAGQGATERPPRVRKVDTPAGPVTVPDRYNYAAMLGRAPTPGNAAGARGDTWRTLTQRLLAAMARAVAPGGTVAVELKDNDEGGRSWDAHWLVTVALVGLPLALDRMHPMPVPGMRKGTNGQQRVTHSNLIVLRRTTARPSLFT